MPTTPSSGEVAEALRELDQQINRLRYFGALARECHFDDLSARIDHQLAEAAIWRAAMLAATVKRQHA